MKLHDEVSALFDECRMIRQSLHRIPELGFKEYKTQQFILDELAKYPPDVIETPAETGVKAVYYARATPHTDHHTHDEHSPPPPTQTVAFRADIDAISIDELNDVDYKSSHEGKMHACGHDGHMTMLLLLARLIHNHRDTLAINVVLLFQPAEEGKGGAFKMLDGGALWNPNVDRIYGMHLWPDVPKGKIGVRWGPMMAESCAFDLIVRGVSTHASSPQYGVDAVVSAALLITMLQTAITRNVDPHSGAVLTIGKIEGGDARNIIANKVVMNATMRMFSRKTYDLLMERMRVMAEGIAVATGASFEINELMHYANVDNPRYLVEDLYNYVDMSDIVITEPAMAAEDFSGYQEKVPGLFMFLGIGGGKNTTRLHHNHFDFDEDALLYGVEVYRRLLRLGDS